MGIALVHWAPTFGDIVFLGDNVSSLTMALSGKGKGPLSALSREISWRKARGGWRFAVAHLPTESNTIADYLSRIHEPSPDGSTKQLVLPEVLKGAAEVRPPSLQQLWTLHRDPLDVFGRQ